MDLSEVQALQAAGLPLRRHPWEICRARLLRDWLRGLSLCSPVVLDIGCGDAYILDALARSRPELKCIGVDTAYAAPQRTAAGSWLYPELSQVPADLPSPGLVTLMDVIEHVPDDLQLLRDLREQGWIRPGARVFVTVPAFQQLFGKHDELLGHFRRYNSLQLRQLLEQAGLRVERVGYWFFLPLLVRCMEIARERLLGVGEEKSGLVAWRQGPAVSKILAAILYVESRISGALGRFLGVTIGGLTCYAVCSVE